MKDEIIELTQGVVEQLNIPLERAAEFMADCYPGLQWCLERIINESDYDAIDDAVELVRPFVDESTIVNSLMYAMGDSEGFETILC